MTDSVGTSINSHEMAIKMSTFSISASKGLWYCSGGCGCGPEFMGIRSRIEASDWKDAIYRTLMSMDLEWGYDLTDEWISCECDGERHMYRFSSDKGIVRYIGYFEHRGKSFIGTAVDIPKDDSDALPTIDYLVRISDADTGEVFEPYISRFMPECVVESILDSFIGDPSDAEPVVSSKVNDEVEKRNQLNGQLNVISHGTVSIGSPMVKSYPCINHLETYVPKKEAYSLPRNDVRRQSSSRILHLKDGYQYAIAYYSKELEGILKASFGDEVHICVMPSHCVGGPSVSVLNAVNRCDLPDNFVIDEDVLVRTKDNGSKHLQKGNRYPYPDYLSMKACGVIPGAKYIIIDDVVTSGSSMIAATQLLKEAGAGEVYCLAFAKTQHLSGSNTDNEEY